MGQLRNKCVLELPSEAATNWTVWVTNSSHWFYVNGEPELCGNASGARSVGFSRRDEGLHQGVRERARASNLLIGCLKWRSSK